MAYSNKYYAGWSSKNTRGYLYIDKRDFNPSTPSPDVSVTLDPAVEDYTTYNTNTFEEPFFIQVIGEDGYELSWRVYRDNSWHIEIPTTLVSSVAKLKILCLNQFTLSTDIDIARIDSHATLLADVDYVYNTNRAIEPFLYQIIDDDGYPMYGQKYLDTDNLWKILIPSTNYGQIVKVKILYQSWFNSITNGQKAIFDTDVNLVANTDYTFDTNFSEMPYFIKVINAEGFDMGFQVYKDIDTYWRIMIPSTEVSQTAQIIRVDYVDLNSASEEEGVIPLILKQDSIHISYNFGDWNQPIIGLQLEFSIINDKDNFFDLLPLLSADEREYKIRVVTISPTSRQIFEGFLNCDTISQKMLWRQSISFVASNYIGKLDFYKSPKIEVLQYMPFINIIDDILRSTGGLFNIKVNSILHAEGDILLSGQTLFNKNGFYTEVFWEDNVERKSGLEILKAILTTFDCYIYWWEGHWYIERYEDLWVDTTIYVEYVSGLTYTSLGVGTESFIVQTETDINTLKRLNQSPTLSIIPGYKTIQINLEDERLQNIISGDLSKARGITDELPAPLFREWLMYETIRMNWGLKGLPKSTIGNSIQRTLSDVNPFIPVDKGLYTAFKVTVEDDSTKLNIEFKYAVSASTIHIQDWSGVWKDYTFIFQWYIRCVGTDDYISEVGEDDDGNKIWKKLPGNAVQYIQEMKVEGSDFDKNNQSVTVSLDIPLGLVKTYTNALYTGPLRGDQNLIFGLGTEIIESALYGKTQSLQAWFGDFKITTTGNVQDNVITGVINNNFLNKKEISLTLFDIESYNYKNGIFRGSDLEYRTERWGTVGGSNEIVQRGVCWNTVQNPTIANSYTINGTGIGNFSSQITGLTEGTTYYVRAYAKDGYGNVSYGDQEIFATLDLEVGAYYQGGFIGYLLQLGDTGYDPNIKHGLIVSPRDVGFDAWCQISAGGPYSASAYGVYVGAGLPNTNLIESNSYLMNYGARFIVDYENAGYTDWFWPSIEELLKIRENKNAIGGFYPDWYWSSTELYLNEQGWLIPQLFSDYLGNTWKFAWCLNFGTTANPTTYKKYNKMRLRAVRTF